MSFRLAKSLSVAQAGTDNAPGFFQASGSSPPKGQSVNPGLPPAEDSKYACGGSPGPVARCEPLLTSAQAATILKIHPKVLERWAKQGEVPALKVGKFWRYRASALDSWINLRLQQNCQPCRMETEF